MDQLLKLLESFWVEVTAILLVSLIGFFYSRLKNTSKKILCTLTRKWWIPRKCQFETGIITTLEKIQSELHPNGGSSLRDAVNKIDIKISRISNKIATLQASTEIMSDTLNICRWAADREGNLVFINRPMKRLIGAYDDESCLGAAWITNIVHIDDRESASAEWARAVESRSEFHHSYRIVNLNTREIIKVTGHARVIVNETGEITGWTGILTPAVEKHINTIY